MSNIVIATDLQPETENALLRALQLAGEHGAQLHIVHVASILSFPSFEENLKIVEERDGAKIQASIEKYPKWESIDVKIHILNGSGGRVEEHIDRFSRDIKADLVVMGADRSTVNLPSFMRTKIEHVLWKGNCPVLAAFKGVTSPYENILMIGKQYTAGFLDLIRKNHQEKSEKRLIRRVEKTLTQFEQISDSGGYDYIHDTPSLDILLEIKSKEYDLAVLEVSFTDPSKPDLGEEVHNIIKDESCDVLLIEK